MLAILSPAKTLDFDSQIPALNPTQPEFLKQASDLVKHLRKLSVEELSTLMNISPKLALLNFERYRAWKLPFSEDNSRPALLAFKGDVYTGFNLERYTTQDFRFAQQHLRILSGLYGILRPLDLIQPYRLEMGTSLRNSAGETLYPFWNELLTRSLIKAINKTSDKTLVNLASKEYSDAIDRDAVRSAGINVISPQFKDWKNGDYKFITFYGKKARGMMADHIIRNQIESPLDLRAFDEEGYRFNEKLSSGEEFVFTRKQ